MSDATRCRYLLEQEHGAKQCSNQALVPSSNILLCAKHTASGIAMLSAAPDLPETPESRATDTAMRLLTAEHEAKCRVYYVQFSDRIKIGTTSNMRSRMQSIPNERILVTEPGSYALEKQRHNEFKHCRVHGEWFRADDEKLQAHIAGLRKTHRWNW